jgi:hypothetical protein
LHKDDIIIIGWRNSSFVANARAKSMFKKQEKFLVLMDGEIISSNVKMTKALAEKLAQKVERFNPTANVQIINSKNLAKTMAALLV